MIPQTQQDRVVVKPIEEETKTSAGFYISAEPNAPTLAKVVAVGPGAKSKKGVLIPMSVKVGDVVCYNKSAGISVQIAGEDLLVLKEADIYGVQEE